MLTQSVINKQQYTHIKAYDNGMDRQSLV